MKVDRVKVCVIDQSLVCVTHEKAPASDRDNNRPERFSDVSHGQTSRVKHGIGS